MTDEAVINSRKVVMIGCGFVGSFCSLKKTCKIVLNKVQVLK